MNDNLIEEIAEQIGVTAEWLIPEMQAKEVASDIFIICALLIFALVSWALVAFLYRKEKKVNAEYRLYDFLWDCSPLLVLVIVSTVTTLLLTPALAIDIIHWLSHPEVMAIEEILRMI